MASNCGKCAGDLKRNDKSLQCSGLCDKIFHMKCTNITEPNYNVIISSKNLGWFCDICADKKNNYLRSTLDTMRVTMTDIAEGLKVQDGKLENLKSKVNNLETNIKDAIEEKKIDSYAEKLKLKKHEPVIIIKPKNQEQKSSDTKREIKKSIDPTDLEISGLRTLSKGSVVIECKNKETISKIKEKAQDKLGDDYEVTVPKKRMPKIKIVGLSERLAPEIIEEKIKCQNNYLESENVSIKVTYVRENKKGRGSFTAIAEVSANAYRLLMKEEKVNINWDRCKIYDALEVTRCFKCSGFGHKAVQCKSQTACPKCAGEHLLIECKAKEEEERCVNCSHAVDKLKMKLDVKHAAWNSACPVLQRKLELEKRKIDFLE